jgi:hypothetical protein
MRLIIKLGAYHIISLNRSLVAKGQVATASNFLTVGLSIRNLQCRLARSIEWSNLPRFLEKHPTFSASKFDRGTTVRKSLNVVTFWTYGIKGKAHGQESTVRVYRFWESFSARSFSSVWSSKVLVKGWFNTSMILFAGTTIAIPIFTFLPRDP